MSTVICVTSPSALFLELINEVFRRRKLPDELSLKDYLAGLLYYFVSEENAKILDEPLAIKLFEREFGESRQRRFSEIREIGDAALFIAGIRGAGLSRSVVGVDHYINIGERAYSLMSGYSKVDDHFLRVYRIFARNLRPFVDVLAEISDDYIMQKPTTINALERFDRYEATGSERDRQWLQEHNIFLLSRQPKDKKDLM